MVHETVLFVASRRRFRPLIAIVASGSVGQTFLNLPVFFELRIWAVSAS